MCDAWIVLDEELERGNIGGWRKQWRKEGRIKDGKEEMRKKGSDERKGD